MLLVGAEVESRLQVGAEVERPVATWEEGRDIQSRIHHLQNNK
jgi:hypothetical protein